MLPTKFRVNRPFSSEEVKKIDFQDGRHLGFSIGMILAIFISTSHPHASYQFSNQLALWFRKSEKKKEFQDGRHDSHFGFPIQTIYLSLDLQVTRMLPTKFRLKWPFSFSVQEKKRKIYFKDGCHSGHLGFLIGMILSIFDLRVTLMLPT